MAQEARYGKTDYNPGCLDAQVARHLANSLRGHAMPSPFPGMNPYVERASVWHDFHESFMPLVREILTSQVLPRYFVRIDEQMYIHERSAEERRLLGRSDLLVPALTPPSTATVAAGPMLEAPAEVRLPAVDLEGQSFLEI